MTIEKSYIELTPDAGDLYTATLSPKKRTGLAAYIIDGSFTTSLSAPDMSGEDFQQMKNTAFKSEYSDLTKQPSPLFYFTKSKTFCMNMVSPYLAACFSTPSAAAGLFQPTVVELHKATGSSVVGEIDYSGTAVYISLPSITRGSSNASAHIVNGSLALAKSTDYGYSLDPKTATKSIRIPTNGWRFSNAADPTTAPSVIHTTDDYVFKYSSDGQNNRLTAFSHDLLSEVDTETCVLSIPANKIIGIALTGCSAFGFQLKQSISYSRSLCTRINIPTSTTISDNTIFTTKVMTPQVIATTKGSYICRTINPYGLGEILKVDTATSATKSVGSSYAAVGMNQQVFRGSLRNNSYSLGLRIVAKNDELSSNISIIKTGSGEGVSAADEASSYKVGTANSYYVLKSVSGSTQEDQSYLYALGRSGQRLLYAGEMQCLFDKNNKHLSDSYDVGVIAYAQPTQTVIKIYVLYDDGSIAISSYNVTVSGSCPMKISSDGKNVTSHSAYIKSYTGGFKFTKPVSSGGFPADGQFIVPDNSSNSRKIEAIGTIYESGSPQDTSEYPIGQSNVGTFLILEEKT